MLPEIANWVNQMYDDDDDDATGIGNHSTEK